MIQKLQKQVEKKTLFCFKFRKGRAGASFLKFEIFDFVPDSEDIVPGICKIIQKNAKKKLKTPFFAQPFFLKFEHTFLASCSRFVPRCSRDSKNNTKKNVEKHIFRSAPPFSNLTFLMLFGYLVIPPLCILLKLNIFNCCSRLFYIR